MPGFDKQSVKTRAPSAFTLEHTARRVQIERPGAEIKKARRFSPFLGEAPHWLCYVKDKPQKSGAGYSSGTQLMRKVLMYQLSVCSL